MQQHNLLRYLLLWIIINSTFSSYGQSSAYIVKSGIENGIFRGGVFIGHNASFSCSGTSRLNDNTDSTTHVVWKDITGISEMNDTLIKSDTTAWGNAGAISNNQLKRLANGWIDYRVDDLLNVLEFGYTTNDTLGLDSIQYAMRLDSGQLYVYNAGVVIDTIGSVSLGDSLRIERLGNVLLYTKNTRVYYNQQVNAKDSLRVEVAMNTYNSLFKIRGTFGLESLIINTTGIDTLDAPDTLRYNIYGVNGVSGVYNTNTSEAFNPVGIASGVQTITTSFYGYPGADSAKVLFDIDKYRNISNVRFKFNDTINQLDSSLFTIDRTGVLAIQDGSKTYESQFSPFFNIILDGGISLTPNNDGQYDSLLVESNVPVRNYYINVTNVAGDTLYESTNISLGWNGRTAGGDPVNIGSYFYHITLNGRLTEGQFLVEY